MEGILWHFEIIQKLCLVDLALTSAKILECLLHFGWPKSPLPLQPLCPRVRHFWPRSCGWLSSCFLITSSPHSYPSLTLKPTFVTPVHHHGEIWVPPLSSPRTLPLLAALLDHCKMLLIYWLLVGYLIMVFFPQQIPVSTLALFPIPFHPGPFPSGPSTFSFYWVDPPACLEQDNNHTIIVLCPLAIFNRAEKETSLSLYC